jgi:hypothetical protein
MTKPPDWILDGYERSGLPAFVAFSREARNAQSEPHSSAQAALPTFATVSASGAASTSKASDGSEFVDHIQQTRQDQRGASHSVQDVEGRAAPEGQGVGAASMSVDASSLPLARLKQLEVQYRISHTPGEVAVTELHSHDGDQVQATNPPWPQHLMLDVYKGRSSISLQYLLPELPGEDLERCARDCRDAILAVLPVTWQGAEDLKVDRPVSWELLSISCGIDLDPGEEQRRAKVRRVSGPGRPRRMSLLPS